MEYNKVDSKIKKIQEIVVKNSFLGFLIFLYENIKKL